MTITKSDIKVGARVFSRIDQEPWEITGFGDATENYVELSRGGKKKMIQSRSMRYIYTAVGSEQHKKHLEVCKRHGWKVWEP